MNRQGVGNTDRFKGAAMRPPLFCHRMKGVLVKVYLAGPMRGYEQFNFPAFYAGASALRALGHRVISPAELDAAFCFDIDNDTVTPDLVRSCVRRDVEALTLVDAVVTLPGCAASRGATAEIAIAGWLGIPVYSLAEMMGDA